MPEQEAREIIVCVNRRMSEAKPSCAARGSEELARAFEEAGAPVTRLKCFGRCAEGPNVRVRGAAFFRGASPEDVPAILAEARRGPRGG